MIGIEHYPQLPPLKAAVRDASRFAKWLVDPDQGSLNPDHVRLITSSPHPTGTDVTEAVPAHRTVTRALNAMKIRERTETGERLGRRLYFYFAGHAFGPTFDEIGMWLMDAARDRANVALSFRGYREFFRTFGVFDEVVYVMDCCRDLIRGPTANGPQLSPPNPASVPKVTDFALLGASWGDKSFELLQQNYEPRGILTEAIIEGLEGKAQLALDVQNNVTSRTLWDHVRVRVGELAEAAPVKIDPSPEPMFPNYEMILSSPATAFTTIVNIINQSGLTGTVTFSLQTELYKADLATLDGATPWPGPIRSGFVYFLEVSAEGAPADPRALDTRNKDGKTIEIRL
ncbi:hypothetical protein GRI89_02835 [Altererythrobacter salegens]|uniref:Caspase domain-containing protein n=1 Tax=Croceibacterium salegens TaxID=1737568 RepID=A0A6I4SRJ6_9SPHN|nr:hypothetical protein [Croceibacterium salegens]MXO58483.1 hypothetical protein [Croceibacterium salegens]